MPFVNGEMRSCKISDLANASGNRGNGLREGKFKVKKCANAEALEAILHQQPWTNTTPAPGQRSEGWYPVLEGELNGTATTIALSSFRSKRKTNFMGQAVTVKGLVGENDSFETICNKILDKVKTADYEFNVNSSTIGYGVGQSEGRVYAVGEQ